MTTGRVELTRTVCSFCGAKLEERLLIQVEDESIFICDQCIRGITGLLKANPGRKHIRYLPERVNKKNR